MNKCVICEKLIKDGLARGHRARTLRGKDPATCSKPCSRTYTNIMKRMKSKKQCYELMPLRGLKTELDMMIKRLRRIKKELKDER